MNVQGFINYVRNVSIREKIVIASSIVILLFFPIIVLISTSSQKQETRTQAADAAIDSLTAQILENNQVGGRNGTNRFLLEDRNLLMQRLATENPQEFLEKAMSPELRDSLPTNLRFLVEEKTIVKGRLVPVLIDNFDKEDKLRYFVQNEDSLVSVNFESSPEDDLIESADQVSITGYKIENSVVASRSDINIDSQMQTLSATGEKKYVAVPVNFIDDRSRPYSTTLIGSRLFCKPRCQSEDSARSYYDTISDGRLKITGDVVGWWESSLKKNEFCTKVGQDKLVSQYRLKASKAFGIYDGIIFISSAKSCSAGTIGGDPSIAWIGDPTLKHFIHELGHNLGVHHANELRCSSKNDCFVSDYGDKSDVMGVELARMNGSHLRALNFKVERSVKEFSGNDTYVVHSLYGNSSPQIIKINVPDTKEDIYVEYRGENTGYDRSVKYKLGAGVLVYKWNGNPSSPTKLVNYYWQTDSGDPVVKDGKTIEISKYSIKLISHDNNSARVKITKD
ncbi:MAG: hypothetical protein KBC84_06680 [Proteobacteria bacterium]|nr:hypothetical protein [Pseudomonadota bacterium]